jgi:hypothetical protein
VSRTGTKVGIMEGRDAQPPRTVLEYLLRQKDRTYEELAADFNRLAQQLGERATLSPRHLRRLATGERVGTNPVTRRVLQRMFDRPAGDLLQPWTDGVAVPILSTPAMTSSARTNEREMITMAAQRARNFTLSKKNTLSAESVDQVHDDVRRLAQAYPKRPLPQILTELVEIQNTVYELLERRQRPQQARDLYLFAGVVGGLLAKASHDFADPHAAMTQARAAFMCADNADHDGLRAWLRGLQTMVAYWAGRHYESVRFARSGFEYATRSHSTVAVWLLASEARSLAAMGNADDGQAAIQRAEEKWAHVKADELDELGGICTFSRARQLYYAADAFAWLSGNSAIAEDYSTQAVEAYSDPSTSDWAFGDQAGAHAALAIARLGRGELDGANEAVGPILKLPPDQRINGVVHSALRVHDVLRRPEMSNNAQTAATRDAIETFARTPIAALR